ncbi:MAG TPA: aminotransferase class I/II-fold pyridoxal phosphate-dependent enzyme [Candidatus Saccharimonadales bacterium]|nr:aminotransferase class I/II-fold pyridoxal phosphate-dependent enzyme [Candidatus Saccharimonadales bacterium]
MSSIHSSDLVAGLEESATLALNARVKKMAADGEKVYNLTAGELSCETPVYIQDYVVKKLNQNKYTPVSGLSELREAIAKYAKDFYKQDWIGAENVVVCPSVKPGIWASLTSIINPGEELILPTPTWVSYKHLVHIAGAKLVQTKLADDFDLDIDDIKSKITNKTKAILLNSPQNPTGATYSQESIERLTHIANENNITVLSDEIYSRLVFNENFKPVSLFDFKNLIILDGFSKSQALTGWRIGYVIAPVQTAKDCTKILSHAMGNASVISQYAALAALQHGNEPVMFEELKSNLDLACSKLDQVKKLHYIRPSGAFYILVDVREMTSSGFEWCEELLQKKGVALVPGEAFDAPGFARISFGGDADTISKGLDLIKEFSEENYA